MTRSPLRCRTSMIASSTLVQASSSLSTGRTRAWPRGSPHQEFCFRHLFTLNVPSILILIWVDINIKMYDYELLSLSNVNLWGSRPWLTAKANQRGWSDDACATTQLRLCYGLAWIFDGFLRRVTGRGDEHRRWISTRGHLSERKQIQPREKERLDRISWTLKSKP